LEKKILNTVAEVFVTTLRLWNVGVIYEFMRERERERESHA